MILYAGAIQILFYSNSASLRVFSCAGEMAQLLKAMRVFSLKDVQSERHYVILAVILQGNSSTLLSRRNGLMVPLSSEMPMALVARTLPGISFSTYRDKLES